MLSVIQIEYLEKIRSFNPSASLDDIRLVLTSSGWKPEEIEDGIAYVSRESSLLRGGEERAEGAAPSYVESAPPPIPPNSSNGIAEERSESPGAMQPRRSARFKSTLIIAAAAVLIAVGGFLAYGFTVGIWPFSRPPFSQSNFIEGIITALSHVESANYKTTFRLELLDREPGAKPFKSKSARQKSTAGNASFRGLPFGAFIPPDLRFEVSLAARSASREDGLGSGKFTFRSNFLNINAAADFISAGDEFYIKLRSLPPLLPFDATPILNKWLKIDNRSLSELDLPSYFRRSEGAIRGNSPFRLPSYTLPPPKDISVGPMFAEELREQVRFAIKKLQEEEVILIRRISKEELDGAVVYRYDLKVDRGNFVRFYEAIGTELRKRYGAASKFGPVSNRTLS